MNKNLRLRQDLGGAVLWGLVKTLGEKMLVILQIEYTKTTQNFNFLLLPLAVFA